MTDHPKPANERITRRDFLLGAAAAASVSIFRGSTQGDQLRSRKRGDIDYSRVIDSIRRNLPDAMAKEHVRSVAIGLVDGQRTVWVEGFGFTDIAKTRPVTADTLFSLQSISKSYTATAFLIAINKGWIKLDDPLKKYLPDFKINSRFGVHEPDKITFRHLLSHWAGLPHEAPLGNNFDERPCTFEQHIDSIADGWLRFPVGKTYCYSNLGVDLAGYVLQVRSRREFNKFIKEELFGPLGMTQSTFNHAEALAAASFAGGDVGNKELLTIPIPMIPSGGMYSNVKDMARFISFHLSGGLIDKKRLISDRHLNEMYTPQFPVQWQVSGYGLGIFAKRFHAAKMLWHGGGGYGYTTMQQWIPEYQIGVVVLTNDGDGSELTGQYADMSLEQMIEAKYRRVPATETLKLTDKPVVELNGKLLRRFEGTYKAYSGLLTLKVESGHLQMIRGGGTRQLDAHSPTEFTASTGTPNTEKLSFDLDTARKPVFVHNLGDNGTDFFVPNDSPSDPPGPNRPEWHKYTGAYKARGYETDIPATILIKNGYLYNGRGVRLVEGENGMFFTTDGDAVIFRDGQMLFGNRPYIKVQA